MKLAAACLALLTLTAPAQESRYQLVPAQIFVGGDHGDHATAAMLFRLDTQTGQTWRYSLAMTTNGVSEHWILVPQPTTNAPTWSQTQPTP